MSNRKMLKEAIADAKTVKETAIANAKAALEEAFTPRLQSMLAVKLQEMEEDMEESYSKKESEMEEDLNLESLFEEEMEEEMDLEEILSGLNEEEVEEEEVTEEEAEGEEAEGEETEGEEEDEEIDLEDMSEEDLKSFIEDVIRGMVEAGELEGDVEGEEGAEGEETEEDELAELLREIEEMEAEAEMGDVSPEDAKIEKAFASITEGILAEDAFPSGPELAAILGGIAALIGSGIAATKLEMYAEKKAKENPEGKWAKILKVARSLGSAAGSASRSIRGIEEKAEKEKDLKEALTTIKHLRNELNEINLLNAKLLYTNKVFRTKNLNESQKVKVLGAFDKATTVKEVKLVFETIAEGIKSESKVIKENLSRASKPAGMAPSKTPIVEVDAQVARWQKLAGLR
jgi:hypothetical protein